MENVMEWVLPVLALASAVVVGMVLMYLIYLAVAGTANALSHRDRSPRMW